MVVAENKKILELDTIPAVDDTSDYIPIVDGTDSTTKKVSPYNLKLGDYYLATNARLQYQADIGIVAQFDTGTGDWADNTAVIAAFGGGVE